MSAEKKINQETTEGIGKALVAGDTWKEIRAEFQVSDRQIESTGTPGS